MKEWASLSNDLSLVELIDREDFWIWSLDKNSFSSMSLSKTLQSSGTYVKEALTRMLSSGNFPKKVMFFKWELSHTCLKAHATLQRKSPGIAFSSSCSCPKRDQNHTALFFYFALLTNPYGTGSPPASVGPLLLPTVYGLF